MDESYYLTTHETALAVVATAMKKARLRIDTLILNSIMGGILFSTGGMLYVLVGSNCYGLNESNPGIVSLIQGALYPIGLFYVVIMGVDLFNSNILFFSAALCRNAVSILDLSISWMVSYWFNLVGNIFVCYVICHYSHVSQEASFVTGSMDIVVKKASFTFVENLIKAMAGNFFVSLAIYLQLMAKPLHVKFFMMALPIFSFVSMGFTHAVADMFIIIIGLINHAPVSVAEIAWKVFLPGALGNMIGGSFFGIVITWYLHLVVVERDQRELNLPKYEVRDEQPELGMDSRVVRQKPSMEEIINDYPNIEEKLADSHESSDSNTSSDFRPQQLFGPSKQSLELKPMMSRATGATRFSTRSRVRSLKSPKNVFPVYGMGPPSKRDSIIANGRYGQEEGNIDDTDIASTYSAHIGEEEMEPRSASYIGEQLKRVVSRRKSTSTSRLRRQPSDLESQRRRLSVETRRSSSSARRPFRTSISMNRNNLEDFNERLDRAKITPSAVFASASAAGIDPLFAYQPTGSASMRESGSRNTYNSIPSETIIDTPIESIPNNDRSESQTPVEDYNITTYQPDSGTAEPTRGTSELHDSEPEVKPKT